MKLKNSSRHLWTVSEFLFRSRTLSAETFGTANKTWGRLPSPSQSSVPAQENQVGKLNQIISLFQSFSNYPGSKMRLFSGCALPDYSDTFHSSLKGRRWIEIGWNTIMRSISFLDSYIFFCLRSRPIYPNVVC